MATKIAAPLLATTPDGVVAEATAIAGSARTVTSAAAWAAEVPLAHRRAGALIVPLDTRRPWILAADLATLLPTHWDDALADQAAAAGVVADRVARLETEVRAGRLGAASWPALAAWLTAPAAGGYPTGTVAEVPTGEGTHTDPVTGATVTDRGVYSAQPAGWQHIGDTTTGAMSAAISALQAALTAEAARAAAAEGIALMAAASTRPPAGRFHRGTGDVLALARDAGGGAVLPYDTRGYARIAPAPMFHRDASRPVGQLVFVDKLGRVAAVGAETAADIPDFEVSITAGVIDVFTRQRGSIGLIHRIEHESYTARVADVWRTTGVWEVTRLGAGLYTFGQEIFSRGEVETAIALVGRTELIGGITHGGERQTSFRAHVDGVRIDHTVPGVYQCGILDLYQSADMFRPGPSGGSNWPDDPPVLIMRGYKHWRFTAADGLLLRQHIDHLAAAAGMVVEHAYFGMAPARRILDGVQVTHSAALSPQFAVVDVSAGFPDVYAQSDTISVWGDRYSVLVKAVDGWGHANRTTRLRGDSDAYNKIYEDYFPGQTLIDGGVWDVCTQIRVTAKV